MSERFVLATHNRGKIREMREILSELGLEVIPPEALGVTPHIEENGTTFAENAMIKAKAVCALTGLPAIGDDSGLCVNALNGGPGVFSARYGGEDISDEQRNKLLLESVKGQGNRDAHFSCAIACAFPNGDTITAEGRCDGVISYIPMGTGGFGYDPVFNYPPKLKTFAQMTPEEKSEVSHRGKALRAFAEKLGAYLSELAWKELEAEKAQQEPAPETPEASENVSDAPEASETAESVTDAPETPEALENVSDAPEASETLENVSDAPETPEASENVSDAPETPEASENVSDAPEASETPETVSEETETAPEVTETPENVPESADAAPESVTDAPENVTEETENAETPEPLTEETENAETPEPLTEETESASDGAEHHHKKKKKRKKHH